MDKQRVMALLQKSEGTKLDFKLQMSLSNETEKKELAKDVSAIANSKGGRGYIIFGIEDKTKRIVGIEGKKYSEEQIQQIISQRCDPPVPVKFDTLPIDDKNIGILTIYKSMQKPHQIRQTGAFYIRRGSTTDIARREEIAGMLQESGMLQYEGILLRHVDIKALDEKIIQNYFARTGIRDYADDYYAVLEGIGVIGRDEDSAKYHPTIGGLLVFGHNPQEFLPYTGIKLINSLRTMEVTHFSGSILKMLDDVEAQLDRLITGGTYPLEALAEALANATVHRDYFVVDREIVINLKRDSIEISNPGAICGEEDAFYAMEECNPRRRNPWLYQRLMILDDKQRFLKSGMGLKRIELDFRQSGGVKFINNEKRNFFKVILPGPGSHTGR